MKNKIKERVLKETKEYACPKCEVDTDGKILPYWSDEGSSCDKWENHIEKTIDLTLASVGKVIDESFLKDMNDSGCSCGSFFNFIEGKFICNGCGEECENKFYEELKKELGI